MKKKVAKIMLLVGFIGFLGIMGCKNSSDPSTWNNEKIDKWFEKGEWLNGWNVTPDGSINRKELAIAYYKNKTKWDKVFTFLKTTDLSKLEVKRHDIDGSNSYAIVSEYLTKNEEDVKFEAHKKYIDVQHVISGVEQMSIASVSMKKDILEPYDETKDIEISTVTKCSSYNATPDKIFIFFPSDIHRPGVKVGENAQVKKVVVKVKVE